MPEIELTELQTRILEIVRDSENISRTDVARRLQTTVRAITPAVRALGTRNLIMQDETGFLLPVTSGTCKTSSKTVKRFIRVVKMKNNNKRSKKSTESLTTDEILESGMFRRPETDIIVDRRQTAQRGRRVSARDN
jgi:hypothetical protein